MPKIVNMRWVKPIQILADPPIAMQVTSVTPALDLMNINSIDALGGANHQPYGFDQWANYYQTYTVMSADIHILITSQNDPTAPVGGQSAYVFGAKIADDGAVLPTTSFRTEIEEGNTAYVVLAPGNNEFKKISLHFDAKKWFSIKDLADNTARLGGKFASPGGGPADTAKLELWVANVSQSATSKVLVDLIVEIDFTVLLSEPKTHAVS